MHRSEPERQRDELRLARLLFAREAQVIDRGAADSSVAERLDTAADALFTGGGSLSQYGLAEIDEESRERIARAFEHARALWPELDVPTVDAFRERGTKLESLAAAIREDETLMPVVAPHGLKPEAWQEAFSRTPTAPGLEFSREVREEFQLLAWPSDADPMPTVPGDAAPLALREPFWTLALLPAADAPPLMGHNYSRGPHPLIGEMLALQLSRARQGLPPVDCRTFTWIAGLLGEGRIAARHVTDTAEHIIRVSTREWAQQGPHQGARPPVR